MGLSTASWVALGLVLVVIAAIYFMLGSFLFGAGYQPTPPAVLRRMMRMAQIGPKDRVYDLGAGTGALLFRSLHEGADRVVGVEIEPVRFAILRLRRWRDPRRDHLELRRENLFATDLHEASVVLTFLWPAAMKRLRPKFEEELPPGARIVSYWHPIPGWHPVEEDRKMRVYSYAVGAPSLAKGTAASLPDSSKDSSGLVSVAPSSSSR